MKSFAVKNPMAKPQKKFLIEVTLSSLFFEGGRVIQCLERAAELEAIFTHKSQAMNLAALHTPLFRTVDLFLAFPMKSTDFFGA